MIIIIVGGIGSGKSMSFMKTILNRRKTHFAFTNFALKDIVPHQRLKISDVVEEYYPTEKSRKPKYRTNWDFWKQQMDSGRKFDIYLDEVHEVINSRSSMSSLNKALNSWLSQIRKILGQSEDSNIYLITQRLGAIDIHFRTLCHEIIECQKIMKGEKVIIYRRHYKSEKAFDNYKYFGETGFIANKYFPLMDSYQIIDFGEGFL